MKKYQITTLKILFHGRVQGVSFRQFAADCAVKAGVNGSAKNLGDGRSVEVIAQGGMASMDTFLRLLKKGPADSLIEKMDIEKIETMEIYNGFDIR